MNAVTLFFKYSKVEAWPAVVLLLLLLLCPREIDAFVLLSLKTRLEGEARATILSKDARVSNLATSFG
jgi:hypothetical protein